MIPRHSPTLHLTHQKNCCEVSADTRVLYHSVFHSIALAFRHVFLQEGINVCAFGMVLTGDLSTYIDRVLYVMSVALPTIHTQVGIVDLICGAEDEAKIEPLGKRLPGQAWPRISQRMAVTCPVGLGSMPDDSDRRLKWGKHKKRAWLADGLRPIWVSSFINTCTSMDTSSRCYSGIVLVLLGESASWTSLRCIGT